MENRLQYIKIWADVKMNSGELNRMLAIKENDMSNLNNWHDEWMNELKQREIRRELEQIRLIKEAGANRSGWMAGAGKALGNLMTTLAQKRPGHRLARRHSHKPLHG